MTTIKPQSHQDLLDLVAMGEYNARIEFDRYAITFNLASGGSEAAAEVAMLRANGGIYNERMRRIAVLSASITSIGPLDLRSKTFEERVELLGSLAPRLLDFLHEVYKELRTAQDVKFADAIAQAKKSLPNPVSAISGGSSE